MFVIFCYDVNSKRVSKVMKICRKYLKHHQNSIFEGMISEAKLSKLKNEVEKIIKKDEDSISIYKIDSIKFASKEMIGKVKSFTNIIS